MVKTVEVAAILASMLALFLAAACEAEGEGACAQWPGGAFAACRVWAPRSDASSGFELTGVVRASGTGAYELDPESQWDPLGPEAFGSLGREAGESWLELEEDSTGDLWALAVDWPEQPAVFSDGERVTVKYDLALAEYFEQSGIYSLHFEIRRADGSLVLWTDESEWSLGSPEELALSIGGERCRIPEAWGFCGEAVFHDLLVGTGTDPIVVPPGGVVDVDGLRVYYGEIVRDEWAPGSCTDFHRDFTSAVVTAAPEGA